MKYSWIFLLLLIIVIGIILGAFANPFVQVDSKIPNSIPPSPTSKLVNYKASFAIFTNGTFRIFTDPKYHNLSPEVFLETPHVNVINVKKDGVTYQDFFNTLPMKLDKNCLITGTNQTFCTGEKNKLRFFINGEEDPNALEKVISEGDKLLVTFGDLTDAQIESQNQKIPNL